MEQTQSPLFPDVADGDSAGWPPSLLLPGFAAFRAQLESYLRQEDITRIETAYKFAVQAHEGQFRGSGEPYASHPLAVANIVADWHLDPQAIIAALLHDVVEDTHISKEDLAERFGNTTAEIVDGLSKLDKIEFRSKEDAQAENFRKMLLAMAADLRVILIKLADRLHNMRTLSGLRSDKQRRIATETLEIYAPISNRLGLNNLYRELQELSFQYRHPLRFRVLDKAIHAARGNRREVIGKVLQKIQDLLPQWGVNAQVNGREKHLFSIYRKMVEKRLSFSQVLDIYGLRVIVEDIPTCYLSIGALHSMFKPVPGKFKDYIALPKANGYQSLHTTLIGPYGTPVEVQVRTTEMHHVAESGVASHWLYKDDDSSLDDLQRKTHSWLQSLLELQSTSGEASEFFEHVKVDLFPSEVYVFTPQGMILSLPKGSTPVDFAYAVHTDIGNRCVACRINSDLMPLRTELRSGDQIEIITSAQSNPNPAWLTYVRTGKARSQIRHFLKGAEHEESVVLGERLLNQALRFHGLSLGQISTFAWDRFLRDRGIKSKKEILSDIGLGKRLPAIVAKRIANAQDQESGRPDVIKPKSHSAIFVSGSEGVAVRIANCCQPIPGDPITGLIRKGKGLEIHRHDCTAAIRLRQDRGHWIEVAWEQTEERLFDQSLRIVTKDGRGVLADIASAISQMGCNIQSVAMEKDRDLYTAINITIQVRDRIHLAHVMRKLRRIPEVVRIQRAKK